MSSQLHLLKSNAVVTKPTPTTAFHTLYVQNDETGCRVHIAATRSLMDPIYARHHGLKDRPVDFVWFRHHPYDCYCASFAKSHDTLFETWQRLHMALRRKTSDNAAYAFYPEFEYEMGEAFAHASLVASLAVGKSIPECYEYLIKDYGAKNLRDKLFPEEEMEGEMGSSDESDDDYDYDSDDSGISINWSTVAAYNMAPPTNGASTPPT
ncbi:hypothetical protein F5Y08DRAFT_239879 [Xylaria arbuscula]|nr:hypothetical protein F5Y08DRAFT_239879 [Xylaria arbuscula]